jgi:hypothetical protein
MDYYITIKMKMGLGCGLLVELMLSVCKTLQKEGVLPRSGSPCSAPYSQLGPGQPGQSHMASPESV